MAEFTLWLRAKLLEEAGEATTVSSQSEFLAELTGLEAAAIECARARKVRTLGTYAHRILWQPVTSTQEATT